MPANSENHFSKHVVVQLLHKMQTTMPGNAEAYVNSEFLALEADESLTHAGEL